MRVTFQVNCVKLDLKCKVSKVNLLKIALISYLAFKGNKWYFVTKIVLTYCENNLFER